MPPRPNHVIECPECWRKRPTRRLQSLEIAAVDSLNSGALQLETAFAPTLCKQLDVVAHTMHHLACNLGGTGFRHPLGAKLGVDSRAFTGVVALKIRHDTKLHARILSCHPASYSAAVAAALFNISSAFENSSLPRSHIERKHSP
jgi:hypothetical protein